MRTSDFRIHEALVTMGPKKVQSISVFSGPTMHIKIMVTYSPLALYIIVSHTHSVKFCYYTKFCNCFAHLLVSHDLELFWWVTVLLALTDKEYLVLIVYDSGAVEQPYQICLALELELRRPEFCQCSCVF